MARVPETDVLDGLAGYTRFFVGHADAGSIVFGEWRRGNRLAEERLAEDSATPDFAALAEMVEAFKLGLLRTTAQVSLLMTRIQQALHWLRGLEESCLRAFIETGDDQPAASGDAPPAEAAASRGGLASGAQGHGAVQGGARSATRADASDEWQMWAGRLNPDLRAQLGHRGHGPEEFGPMSMEVLLEQVRYLQGSGPPAASACPPPYPSPGGSVAGAPGLAPTQGPAQAHADWAQALVAAGLPSATPSPDAWSAWTAQLEAAARGRFASGSSSMGATGQDSWPEAAGHMASRP